MYQDYERDNEGFGLCGLGRTWSYLLFHNYIGLSLVRVRLDFIVQGLNEIKFT